jgi:hypothetical protein
LEKTGGRRISAGFFMVNQRFFHRKKAYFGENEVVNPQHLVAEKKVEKNLKKFEKRC